MHELHPDSALRPAFRRTLATTIARAFPDAQLVWIEGNRRLLITFPGGAVCTLYEPNWYFALPSAGADALCAQAVAAVAAQRQAIDEQR